MGGISCFWWVDGLASWSWDALTLLSALTRSLTDGRRDRRFVSPVMLAVVHVCSRHTIGLSRMPRKRVALSSWKRERKIDKCVTGSGLSPPAPCTSFHAQHPTWDFGFLIFQLILVFLSSLYIFQILCHSLSFLPSQVRLCSHSLISFAWGLS